MFLSFVFLLSVYFVNAQYKSYKDCYNLKTYSYEKTDQYNPTTAGVLAIIPGAGHCYAGEPWRGLAFVGGMVGSFGVAVAGFALLPWDESGRSEVPGYVIGAIGWCGVAAFYIWSIIDAGHVAKIKNMKLRGNNISLKMEPCFRLANQNYFIANTTGLTLKINF